MEKQPYLYCQSQIEDEVKRCKKQCKDCAELQQENLERLSECLSDVKFKNK